LKSSELVKSQLLTRSPPIGGAFTGVMFGVYSFGMMEPVLDPADFSVISLDDWIGDYGNRIARPLYCNESDS
jgi:hypothetical protein